MSRNVSRSHWLTEAFNKGDQPLVLSLSSDIRADVCVIGGGFTGLWSAINLKRMEPSLDIILIERDFCGSGASGRNGGFLVSWWAKYLTLRKICGEEEALRLARASDNAITEILDFCQVEEIDVQARRDGWLWAATNDAQIGAWQETLNELEKIGENPFEEWSPDKVAHRSGSAVHLAGVYDPSPASIQPAQLVLGMRQKALDMGVLIFEESPMSKIKFGLPAVVETEGGRVVADRIVLAINAWGARFGEIRKSIAVVSGDIVITAQMEEQLEKIGWSDGLGISDGRALVNYYRTTRDGRIVFGKGGMGGEFCYGGNIGLQVEGSSKIASLVTQSLRSTYPSLPDLEIVSSWRGPIDRSQSGLPFFWQLGPHGNVHYAVGFSGNGIGPSYLAGKILASLALERSDEWSTCPLVRSPSRDFPREPFRYFGSKLLRRALVDADRAQDEDRPIPWFSRIMSRFAPAGVSPFKVNNSSNG